VNATVAHYSGTGPILVGGPFLKTEWSFSGNRDQYRPLRSERMTGPTVIPQCNILGNRAVVHQPGASSCMFVKRVFAPLPLPLWRGKPCLSRPAWPRWRPPC
jgi:hypothetical protein